ncbi:GNAT family N-acetyltransferase [Undibacterium fentianense]|uniref:GNAT family N-acetyltransferase n=1 Tax=Undibacterium fentianense TaxID=2828728 RepID=A0A941IGJ5_9BURK|nr:GNAT family N-acetyltransferase [Undibacterium fentianense]MBR7801437.1 GNAT family N-acetyltransferase [Undibacterium fentianense]
MLQFIRTDSNNLDFQQLVLALDRYLAITDGDEHAFYAQFNKSDGLKNVLVVYQQDQAIACGAIKHYADGVTELKRMYVAPNARGRGLASQVLTHLENWAIELDYGSCILETGVKQLEAIRLYQKNSYQVIPNYGQYVGMQNSVCFCKNLSKSAA